MTSDLRFDVRSPIGHSELGTFEKVLSKLTKVVLFSSEVVLCELGIRIANSPTPMARVGPSAAARQHGPLVPIHAFACACLRARSLFPSLSCLSHFFPELSPASRSLAPALQKGNTPTHTHTHTSALTRTPWRTRCVKLTIFVYTAATTRAITSRLAPTASRT